VGTDHNLWMNYIDVTTRCRGTVGRDRAAVQSFGARRCASACRRRSGGDDELLAGVGEARIYVGHTHLPFQRVGAAGVEIVNPGSVGMPFDGNPRAAYALLDDDGTVQQRRVHYDHASAARRVREQARGAAWGETVGKRIERAQFLVR